MEEQQMFSEHTIPKSVLCCQIDNLNVLVW
jgi:hypothetical protein